MAKLGLVGLTMAKDQGATRASRLADIYIKTHAAGNGQVTDPSVYQEAIDKYLSPFSDNLVVQSKIATLQNTASALSAKQEDEGNSLADLKLREHNSLYITEDNGADSFRNPKWIAETSSESLDALVASVASVIDNRKSLGKETATMETYLGTLMKKANRMRELNDRFNSGSGEVLNGYGYYVDVDPTTGKVSGASILPDDVPTTDLSEGKVRTNTVISVGGVKVPVYLPTTSDNYGQKKINFAGKTYKGDSSLLKASDSDELDMQNTSLVQSDKEELKRGKLYKTFSGKSNIDGSPEEKILYVGYDSKIYNVDPNKPKDKSFLDSMKSINGDSIKRLNPYVANKYSTSSMPDDDLGFITNDKQATFMPRSPIESPVSQPAPEEGLTATEPRASFFNRKNTFAKPKESPVLTGLDVIQKGVGFFKKKLGLE
jgi:hypothetical protein